MNHTQKLVISYYDIVTALNEEHHVYLVQHRVDHSIAVRKELDVYNLKVYQALWDHPLKGTPQILAFDEENGRLTIIEEYIRGTSLQEKIDSFDLTYESILYYSLKLCRILDSMHSFDPPVVHRDIKPSNVMITPSDEVVLLDFNAAKQFSCDGDRDTVLLGTKGYAAPEQYGFGTSTPQTDIYGFGMLLKEMVAVLRPERYDLDPIIQTCTRLDPVDRYESVRDLEQALLAETDKLVKEFETYREAKNSSVNYGDARGRYSKKQGYEQSAGETRSTNQGYTAFTQEKESSDRGFVASVKQLFAPTWEPEPYTPAWRRFLPPGFRRGNIVHMLIAAFVYYLCFYVFIDQDFSEYTRPGEALAHFMLNVLFMFAGIILGGDYLNIQEALPGCRSSNLPVRLASVIFWTFIGSCTELLVVSMILALVYD